MEQVTICGFGNVGKSLVHKLSGKFEVSIFTLSSETKDMEIITKFKNKEYRNKINAVYTDERSLKSSDTIIITVPNFLREKLVERIKKHLKKDAVICFIPGIGPSQFIINKYLKNYNVFCLERVPFIARAKNNIVTITGDREKIKYSRFTKKYECKELLEKIFEKNVEETEYYNVTFTSSNAILHTTRLFSIFHGNEEIGFENKVLFYREWNDEASSEFKKCDDEIIMIYKKLKNI